MRYWLIEEERDKLGYQSVITEPQDVLKSLITGQTWVLDEDGYWYNCHPKATHDCAMRDAFPEGAYGVRWEVGKFLDPRT